MQQDQLQDWVRLQLLLVNYNESITWVCIEWQAQLVSEVYEQLLRGNIV